MWAHTHTHHKPLAATPLEVLVRETPQTIQAVAVALAWFLEVDGKSLLLKTLFTSDTGSKELSRI